MEIRIRSGVPGDVSFLEEMLFEAAYWRFGTAPPSLEQGLKRPDLKYLLKDWGQEGDTAVVAVRGDDLLVGAAWYRFWKLEKHSYGFISPEIPEMAIAVKAEFRRRRIGHQLLGSLLKIAASRDIEEISLSVEVDNPALNLYCQHGFEAVIKNKSDWIMVAKTSEIR